VNRGAAFLASALVGLAAARVGAAQPLSKSTFKLHLFAEPTTLSPFLQRNSNSSYFLSQMSCPLLKWTGTQTVEAGASCRFQKQFLLVECQIDPALKFQDGSPVTALHYQQSFQQFVNPDKPSPRAELLLSIKNAGSILKKEKPLSSLGIKADQNKLTIELENPDPEFLLRLANPLLTAVATPDIPILPAWQNFKSCGPYQISSWSSGKSILLAPNPHFNRGHADRPPLQFLFVTEDSLALQYYQKNDLDFLRRLPTLYIPAWKDKPDYRSIQQIRFDSLLLSPDDRKPKLAKALAQSIDYEAWRQLYFAAPRPGCFGLPAAWTDGPICWDFKPSEAKATLKTLKPAGAALGLRLFYSKQGGDDHDRTMEFLQDQWKKNLSLEVHIEAQENKIFVETLRAGKISFFRKGLAPDRASCLAVLENFRSDHPENYVKFQDPDFDQLIDALKKQNSKKSKAKLCRDGVLALRDKAYLIPTGPIYFSLLVKPNWEGVQLNNLNHLDLSQLHLKAAPALIR
jgi:oligopeptide transport system substrate-binding protein